MQALRPLETIPITHGVSAVKIDPKAKYIIFISEGEIGAGDFVNQFTNDPNNPFAVGTPVYVVSGNIERAIKIFQLFDTKVVRTSKD